MEKAIIYTSNSGYTAQYAQLLAEKTGLTAFSSKEAKKKVPAGTKVIYLGWIMASNIKGYKDMVRQYDICAVCGVGMGASGSQIKEVRKATKLPETVELFTLQGGFDINKLHGIYKLMMKIMIKTEAKALSQKQDRSKEEEDMLHMMLYGGNHVSEENLQGVLNWYHNWR